MIAGAPLVLYVGVLPLMAMLRVRRWHRTNDLQRQAVIYRAGFLFAGFRDTAWWWEATAFVHKVVVVAMGSLLVDTFAAVQVSAALGMAIIMHAAVLYVRPLRMKRLYRLQAGASAALVGTYLVAIVLLSSDDPALAPSASGWRDAAAWLAVALNVGFPVWWMYEVALRKPVRKACRARRVRAAAATAARQEARRREEEAKKERKRKLAMAMPDAFGSARHMHAVDGIELPDVTVPAPQRQWEREWKQLAAAERTNAEAHAVMSNAARRLGDSSQAAQRMAKRRKRIVDEDGNEIEPPMVQHRRNPLLG